MTRGSLGTVLVINFFKKKCGLFIFFHLDNATFFNGVFQNVESVALFFGKYVFQ